MFEVTEQRLLPGSIENVGGAVPGAVYQASMVHASAMMPGYWEGKGPKGSWGVVPTVAVRLFPGQGGTMAEVRVGAEVDTTSLVIFGVLFFFFFPAAVLVGYLAYDDFQKRRTGMIHAIWQNLGAGPPAFHGGGQPGYGAPPPGYPPPGNPPPPQGGYGGGYG
jgi:hypothetical protein